MEAKLETLANGIQKQTGTKSARRLEAAISNMKALERQAAIVQSPLVQRSPAALRSRTAELSPSLPQRNEGLESMRQRLLDMESRARDRAKLQLLQQQHLKKDEEEATVSTNAAQAQSAEMKAAKQAVLSALCASGTSFEALEAAALGLKQIVEEASADDPGLAEAKVMLGAAHTRMRGLRGS